MDAVSMLIEYLKQKHEITSLEKDILDTWNELMKNPFDMSSAQQKISSNDISHPEISVKIDAQPQTVRKQAYEITEVDLRYILQSQLMYLIDKELEEHNNGR